MKQAIIDKMAAIVEETMTSYKSDFYEHDMNSLQNYDGRFVWQIGNSHTFLSKMGDEYMDKLFSTEEGVYAVAQRNTSPDASLNYNGWGDDAVYYYDGGDELVEISKDEGLRIWNAIRSFAIFQWENRTKKTFPTKFKKKIKLCCSISYLKEQLAFSDSIGGNLREQLHWKREGIMVNSTHVIHLHSDFAEHSFFFDNIYQIDGETKSGLCGGIIYYNGKWNTHT